MDGWQVLKKFDADEEDAEEPSRLRSDNESNEELVVSVAAVNLYGISLIPGLVVVDDESLKKSSARFSCLCSSADVLKVVEVLLWPPA